MGKKELVCLNLDSNIRKIAKAKGINLSELARRLLTEALMHDTKQIIDNQIQIHQENIQVLETMKKDIEQKEIDGSHEKRLYQQTWDELLSSYSKRKRGNTITDHNDDRIWITGPGNKKKCAFLGKSPDEILSELEKKHNTMVMYQ